VATAVVVSGVLGGDSRTTEAEEPREEVGKRLLLIPRKRFGGAATGIRQIGGHSRMSVQLRGNDWGMALVDPVGGTPRRQRS
jgi:hypothetical protein